MQHPEYIYYAAMVIAAFCAPLNRLASLIVLVWAVGQIVPRLISMTEIETLSFLMAIDFMGFCAGVRWCNRTSDAFGISLFMPMILIHAMHMQYLVFSGASGMHPYHSYWILYWLALLQFTAMLGTVNFAVFREARDASRDLSWFKHLLKVAG